MRICVIHNKYTLRGGEDSVVESEVKLLRDNGHHVDLYERQNSADGSKSLMQQGIESIWNRETALDLNELILTSKPDLLHVHNTWSVVSPSVYWWAGQAEIPVVQTLHNFRLSCLNGIYMREGKICEDCLGRLPWRGVARRCYRNSLGASVALASSLVSHRAIGTYRKNVSRFIALNAFCRDKFVQAGLPAERISIKPNFVEDSRLPGAERSGLLFVGRLSAEKGINVLVDVMRNNPAFRIRVVGEGPLEDQLRLPNIDYLGALAPQAVYREMSQAALLVLPSIWYENFPRTIVEAFCQGLPVLCSRLGALEQIVRDGETGLHFEAGCAGSLTEAIKHALLDPHRLAEMGKNAREEYVTKYSPEVNYSTLLAIYESALARASN